jgi:hypothetical protein
LKVWNFFVCFYHADFVEQLSLLIYLYNNVIHINMNTNLKSKFTELIAMRFTKQELQRLEEAVDDQAIGASTLVHILVNQAVKPVNPRPRRMMSEEFREVMVSTLARLDKDKTQTFQRNLRWQS